MNIDRIKRKNGRQFIRDYQSSVAIVVKAQVTDDVFAISKQALLSIAQNKIIAYSMSDKIYLNGKLTMVVE